MSGLRPSRRTLAKGAVWTAPAVVVAAAAPAYASTPVACPPSACLRHTIGSAPTWSLTFAGSPLIWLGYSRVTLNIGSIDITPSCAPEGTTGFYIDFVSVTGYDQDGNPHTGSNLLTHRGPYVMGGSLPVGGALWVRADFEDFSYDPDGTIGGSADWNSSHHLNRYDITYAITYLDGLDPIVSGCAGVGTVTATSNIGTWITGELTRIS
jgi:hypothetical protein